MPIIHPVTGREIKLGRTRARRNGLSRMKASLLHSFLDKIPDDFAPTVVDNTSGIDNWGMMMNDTLGDCTIACPGHMIQAWTAKAGSEVTVPDTDILSAYEEFDGYINGDPATDQGGDILTVCQDWEKSGIGGHLISNFAEVNMTQMRWQQALYCFGALNVGVELPQGFQDQIGGTFDFDSSKPVNPPDPTQGHCMAVVGYNSLGPVFVTWGALQQASWKWAMYYANECIACFSPDWKNSPVDATELQEALVQFQS